MPSVQIALLYFVKYSFSSIFMLLDSFEDLRQIQSLKKLPGDFSSMMTIIRDYPISER